MHAWVSYPFTLFIIFLKIIKKDETMEIRKIREEEKHLTIELRRYSFGTWTDEKISDIELADIIPENTIGIFDQGKLMSMVRIYELKQNLRGTMKDAGGVASIGTYPQARHRGYVSALMKECFNIMRDKQVGLSILMPFKDSFYERYGYTIANSKLMVKTPIKSLSHYQHILKANEWVYDLIRAKDGKLLYLNFIKGIAPDIHGYCIFEGITDGEWLKANRDGLIVTVKHQGELLALAKYNKKSYSEGNEIIVNDMFWKSFQARDRLFSYFSQHIDQVAYITLPVPLGVNISGWIKDTMEGLKVEMPGNPWMVRVCDFEKAVSGITCPISGVDVNILVKDPHCEWNNGLFKLTGDGNMLNVRRIESGSADVTVHAKGLSAMVYGTLPLEDIVHRGWMLIETPTVKPVLAEVFPQKPIYLSHDYRSTYL
jgi:predicted acetyltransferase